VTVLPLTGEIAHPDAEISGLAWYGDTLLLLPQYPERFRSTGDGSIFSLQKSQIMAFLAGEDPNPLQPARIPLIAPGLDIAISGFEGFESIAIAGDRIYLTIESKPGVAMMGYVVRGNIAPDLSVITLDINLSQKIEPQAELDNFSDESLLVWSGKVMTFYESNGLHTNPDPVVHTFDLFLRPLGTMPMASIEYRITDVTAADSNGRFWAINYLFPGDIAKLEPAPDTLVSQFGAGETHGASDIVERLVEFRIQGNQVVLTDNPPIQLQLLADQTARNWEGIVRLGDEGFLLATDKYPETILGFVPSP